MAFPTLEIGVTLSLFGLAGLVHWLLGKAIAKRSKEEKPRWIITVKQG
jgi:hypothetical protein